MRVGHFISESAYGQIWNHTLLANRFEKLKFNWTAERLRKKKRQEKTR